MTMTKTMRMTRTRILSRSYAVFRPTQHRQGPKFAWKWACSPAAFVFAHVVFLCDGLLSLKTDATWISDATRRFFSIASRLPMELQVVLCHWVCGSDSALLQTWKIENAFKRLANDLLWRRKKRHDCNGNDYYLL